MENKAPKALSLNMYSLADPTESTTTEAGRKTESAVQCTGQDSQLFSLIDELTNWSSKHKPVIKLYVQ